MIYKVLVKAYALVLVTSAKDESEACLYVANNIRFGQFEMDEVSCESQINEADAKAAERAKEHCAALMDASE